MTIVDGVWKKVHLCPVCFEQSASPEELAIARSTKQAIRTGKCQYCGAPAVGGSIFSDSPGLGVGKAYLCCEQCRQDLIEFNRRENSLLNDFDVKDEIKVEQMPRLLAEREGREREFMRQRVMERKPK